MKSNNVKIVIIVVCLAAVAAVLFITKPWKSSGGVTPTIKAP